MSLTTGWVHLPGVLDKEIGINLMDVEAAFLTEGRGTVDSKDRNLRQGRVVKDIWTIQRVVDLGQLDLEDWLALVHWQS